MFGQEEASKLDLHISVSMTPGAYAFTVIPYFPSSPAAACVSPRTANLVPTYALMFACWTGFESISN